MPRHDALDVSETVTQVPLCAGLLDQLDATERDSVCKWLADWVSLCELERVSNCGYPKISHYASTVSNYGLTHT